MNSFNPPKNSIRQVILEPLFHIRGNQGTENLSDFPKVLLKGPRRCHTNPCTNDTLWSHNSGLPYAFSSSHWSVCQVLVSFTLLWVDYSRTTNSWLWNQYRFVSAEFKTAMLVYQKQIKKTPDAIWCIEKAMAFIISLNEKPVGGNSRVDYKWPSDNIKDPGYCHSQHVAFPLKMVPQGPRTPVINKGRM